jgi:hypothetical protein
MRIQPLFLTIDEVPVFKEAAVAKDVKTGSDTYDFEKLILQHVEKKET